MRQIAIIADDLTGASDAGVQFVRKGLRTSVLFDAKQLAADTEGVEATAIDLDSRTAPAAEAYARARDVAGRAVAAGFAHIYKKVDSTLRGNLGYEIDGVMDAVPFDVAIVAPAFPRLGRTTTAGRHFLNGVPVHATEIARDPTCPVHESDIAKLLGAQSHRLAGKVDLGTVRAGAQAIRGAVGALVVTGVQLAVCDAEADSDLAAIAQAMAASGLRVLWVGCAGLAEFLPAALGLCPPERPPFRMQATGKPVLLLAGSVSRTTVEQAARVAAEPGVTAVELNPVLVLDDGPARAAELGRCGQAVAGALGQGRDVAFTTGAAPAQIAAAREAGARLGLTGTAVSDRIAAAMGEVAAAALRACTVQGVIMTGGDTARAVCRALDVTGVQLLRELEVGVPLSRLMGGPDLLAVTKAGAFGTADTLLRALRTLKGDK